ncbi:conserved Plasmodium protein, unknown function [Plasmodium berghei]|uniref:Uncharacterized protein n=2 Tax=Plasmodium berghei TaxID=5821 RepID=A0A509AK50_PLABA|nr:conserved Plasmodium protein, unknown function [Plasmodium berghei ANKA]CXH94882.1 conserved Plasmodium protein, unknown function [Plasmodium berghei]SCL90963.1 conserved Plasmodium protein, unknown function [Plasmodium berghei]SCM15393.1 conserved Plasmodium protein, unknown function [Plasmodium berghei]SCN22232.1 conserved Plasmodium protein, unknown function [Plasmodium berghei]VUC54132.1 conserved Plasmodium protein, unknown function [Plasmodium berghei ANKA]|eukprot:XP_034419977.1 conserved Plasmodium protein, unknown function [Plasmodium berghei ANKA]
MDGNDFRFDAESHVNNESENDDINSKKKNEESDRDISNGSQSDRSQSNRSQSNRSQGNRSQGNRSQGNRSQSNRSQSDRSQSDRSQSDRSQSDRSQSNRSQGNRSQGNRSQGNRSQNNRSQSNRSQSNRSQSNRSQGNRSQSDRSQSDRSQSDRSQSNRNISGKQVKSDIECTEKENISEVDEISEISKEHERKQKKTRKKIALKKYRKYFTKNKSEEKEIKSSSDENFFTAEKKNKRKNEERYTINNNVENNCDMSIFNDQPINDSLFSQPQNGSETEKGSEKGSGDNVDESIYEEEQTSEYKKSTETYSRKYTDEDVSRSMESNHSYDNNRGSQYSQSYKSDQENESICDEMESKSSYKNVKKNYKIHEIRNKIKNVNKKSEILLNMLFNANEISMNKSGTLRDNIKNKQENKDKQFENNQKIIKTILNVQEKNKVDVYYNENNFTQIYKEAKGEKGGPIDTHKINKQHKTEKKNEADSIKQNVIEKQIYELRDNEKYCFIKDKNDLFVGNDNEEFTEIKKNYNKIYEATKLEKRKIMNLNYIYNKYKILLSEIKSNEYLNSIEMKLNLIENSLFCISDLYKEGNDGVVDSKLDITQKLSELFENVTENVLDTYDEAIKGKDVDNLNINKKNNNTEKKKNEQLNLSCDFNLFLRVCKIIINDENVVYANSKKNILFYNNIYKINYLFNCVKNNDILFNVYCKELIHPFEKLFKGYKEIKHEHVNRSLSDTNQIKWPNFSYTKKGIIDKINILWFYETFDEIHYLHLYNLNNINSKMLTISIDSPVECIDIVFLNSLIPLDSFYNSIKNYYLMLITEQTFYFFNIHLYFNCEEDYNISLGERLIYQNIYPFYFNIYLFLLFKLPKGSKKKYEYIKSIEKSERIFLVQDDGNVLEFVYEKEDILKPLNIFKHIIINTLSILVNKVNNAFFSNNRNIEYYSNRDEEDDELIKSDRSQYKQNFNNFHKLRSSPKISNQSVISGDEYDYANNSKVSLIDESDKNYSENKTQKRKEDDQYLYQYNKNIYCDNIQQLPIKFYLKKIINPYFIPYFYFHKNRVKKILIDSERSILYVLYKNSDLYIKLLSNPSNKNKNYTSETIIFSKNDLVREVGNIFFVDDTKASHHDIYMGSNSNNNMKISNDQNFYPLNVNIDGIGNSDNYIDSNNVAHFGEKHFSNSNNFASYGNRNIHNRQGINNDITGNSNMKNRNNNNINKFMYPSSMDQGLLNKLEIIDIHINYVYERNNIFLKMIDNNLNIYYISLVKNIENNSFKVVLKDFQNYPHKKGLKINEKECQVVFTHQLKNLFIVLKKVTKGKKKNTDEKEGSSENYGNDEWNATKKHDGVKTKGRDMFDKSNNFGFSQPPPFKFMGDNIMNSQEINYKNSENEKKKKNVNKKIHKEGNTDYEIDWEDAHGYFDPEDENKDQDKNDEINKRASSDNKQNKETEEVYYKLKLLTSSDENGNFLNSKNSSNSPKSKFIFKNVNEYIINEEIIGIMYKKKNYYFHEFFETAQKNNAIKDLYLDKMKYNNINEIPSVGRIGNIPPINEPNPNLGMSHHNSIPNNLINNYTKSSSSGTTNNMNFLKNERNGISMHYYDNSKKNLPYYLNSQNNFMPNKSNLIINDNLLFKPNDRSSSDHKDNLKNIPPFYLNENTVSEYQEYYDVLIITNKSIYYISRNTKVQKIEKMINNYLPYIISFENRNIKNIFINELKIKEAMITNESTNLEGNHFPTQILEKQVLEYVKERSNNGNIPFNKNLDGNNMGKGENDSTSNSMAVFLKKKNEYELIYEYFINQIIQMSTSEEFLFIIWCLLLNHVHKYEIMCFNNIHNVADSRNSNISGKHSDYRSNSKIENSQTAYDLGFSKGYDNNFKNNFNYSIQGKNQHNRIFEFNHDFNITDKSLTHKHPFNRIDMNSINYSNNNNNSFKLKEGNHDIDNGHIDYDILNRIYKRTPFKFGFIDNNADYIIKQGKLQKAMELEIKTRKVKGINHLFNDNINELDNEIGKNGNKGNINSIESKYQGTNDSINKKIVYSDAGYTNLYNMYQKKNTRNKLLTSEKNKSGNFAFEYLTNKNFDILFLKNVNMYNSSLHIISRGLLLLLSRLLKPIMFINIFTYEKYRDTQFFKFLNYSNEKKESKYNDKNYTEQNNKYRSYTKGIKFQKIGEKHSKNYYKNSISIICNDKDDEIEESFYSMNDYCIVRINDDYIVNFTKKGNKKRKRNIYESNDILILKGVIPLDCCLNLIEKLKCLSICVSIVLTNLLKRKKDYANKMRGITDVSIINIYYDYTVIMINEINEFYSVLNFINFSIEYLLIYSIIICDYYRCKKIIKKKNVDKKKNNFLYLPSSLFDLLIKCNFLKVYMSKTYREILKQCLFYLIKSGKYIPVDFFQGYIIHKTEFLALFLIKKIEEEVFLKKKMKIKDNFEYYKNDGRYDTKYDEFLASEKRAEHFINANLKDSLVNINIFKLVILLYKADYYRCASTLISFYIDSYYKTLPTYEKDVNKDNQNGNIRDSRHGHYIDKNLNAYNYENMLFSNDNGHIDNKMGGIYNNEMIISNIGIKYNKYFYDLYTSCFLPVDKIVHVNYLKYLFKHDERKKNKIKRFLITLLEYSNDINFHFFIFNLILYKCKNEFPCSIFDFTISPYLYFYVKFNEMNIKDAYIYYFKELKYQDIVIFFSRKAFRKWDISPDHITSLKSISKILNLKKDNPINKNEGSKGPHNSVRKIENFEKPKIDNQYITKEKQFDIEHDKMNKISNDKFLDPFHFSVKMANQHKNYEQEININKNMLLNELARNNYLFENNFIDNNNLTKNPLYNNETKEIFCSIYKYLFRIISYPSLKNRLEYIDNCMKAKIFFIQKIFYFKKKQNKNEPQNSIPINYINGEIYESNNEVKSKNTDYNRLEFVRRNGNKKNNNEYFINDEVVKVPRNGKYSSVQDILNINCYLKKEVLKNYYLVDKTISYDNIYSNSVKLLFANNKCLFKLKDEYISNHNNYYLNLKDIKKFRTSLNYQKMLFYEIVNLFVFYVFKFCDWNFLKNYFDILMNGSKEDVKKVLEHFNNINNEEIDVINKSFSNMYDYLCRNRYEYVDDIINDYNKKIKNVNSKINISRIIDIIDTFKEYLIVIQTNIYTKEELKNNIFFKSNFLFKNFLPSFNLLRLIILCDKKKEKIDNLNNNCFSTVSAMLKRDPKCNSFYFSKYSFCFERLIDLSLSLAICFENVHFIINYIGDILKLYDKNFNISLYLLVVLKLHKFMNNLFEIKKIRLLLKKKIDYIKSQKYNEQMKLIYFLNCIPLIYLDPQMNVILINESYEYKGNQDQIIFSKLSPFSLISKMVNNQLRSVYSYHDYTDNYNDDEEEGIKNDSKKSNQTKQDKKNERNSDISDVENIQSNSDNESNDVGVLKRKIKYGDTTSINKEGRKALYYLYNVNYCFNKKENGLKRKENYPEVIVLSHQNYCFYITWISNLLLNHKVEYKSLINVYLKIHNNLKHKKASNLEEHEISIIIYYLFTMWINGDKNNTSFFFYNDDSSYNEKNNIGYFLKDKYGKLEYINNYSLITLLKELLSRAEFYFEYTSDAASRNYDISCIILDSSIYDHENFKKSSVDILAKFFDEIYVTFNDSLTKIPFLNHIIEFQNIHEFLKKFKIYLEEIAYKVALSEQAYI